MLEVNVEAEQAGHQRGSHDKTELYVSVWAISLRFFGTAIHKCLSVYLSPEKTVRQVVSTILSHVQNKQRMGRPA